MTILNSPDLRLRKKVSQSFSRDIPAAYHTLLVVDRQPTSVSVASFTEAEADKAAVLFHQPHFRW